MLGVPQVVNYRVSALTAMIVRRKLKSPLCIAAKHSRQ